MKDRLAPGMASVTMGLVAALLAGLSLLSASAALAQDADPCVGAQLLATPRPEESCLTLRPQVFASPDQALRAVVMPVGMDLHASPDIESRVVIRGPDATLLNSKDYSSTRGTEGYSVAHGEWSPDSQFFVFSLSSSGGHSPWSFPTWVYDRQNNRFFALNGLVEDKPTVSDHFSFVAPHSVRVRTLEKVGSDKQVEATVDLGMPARIPDVHCPTSSGDAGSATCAGAASVDCTREVGLTERAICRDPSLVQFDARMATLYGVVKSLVAMGQRDTLRDAQRQWLKTRDACRDDRSCLADAYGDRLHDLDAALTSIASKGPF